MNYLKEVAKLLGCELGEEFNVIYDDGKYSKYNPFKFTETSLVDKDGDDTDIGILHLITGEYKIEKLPFVPKMGEIYWTYYNSQEIYIETYCWNDSSFDKERKLLGIVFRTKEDAERNLPLFLERLEKEC